MKSLSSSVDQSVSAYVCNALRYCISDSAWNSVSGSVYCYTDNLIFEPVYRSVVLSVYSSICPPLRAK